MLNLKSAAYKYMTPERYMRYLRLLRILFGLPEETYAARDLHLHLEEEDRDKDARHAMISRLRRDGVILRERGLPVRYQLRRSRIVTAFKKLVRELTWHGVLSDPPELLEPTALTAH